jgi:SsrA-binding protein
MIKNKKASFDYEFIEEIIAGIKLIGGEIKSIRKSETNLKDSFCYIKNNELYSDFHISEYKYSSYNNYEPNRPKKLLVTKSQLKKIKKAISEKGLTVVPYILFIDDRGFAKLKIEIARGKKVYDKRETIKQKDVERNLKNKI